MKEKIAKIITTIIIASVIYPTISFGRSVDEIQAEEEAASTQVNTISADIQTALANVNEKYQAVNSLNDEISAAESKITETQSKIEKAKADIAKRKAAMGQRLQELQISGTAEQGLARLLEADSFSDFITRLYAVTVLQQSDNTKVESLQQAANDLANLESELDATITQLSDNKTSLANETASLETDINKLKVQLADKEGVIQQLNTEKSAEQERLAKEAKAAKEAEAKAKEVVAKNTTNTTNTSTTVESSNTQTDTVDTKETNTTSSEEKPTVNTNETQPDPEPETKPEEPVTSGKTLTVSSTAYSYSQPGLSYYTATGTDLRQNPNVIAVDPSVIPLGSMVEIPGYGIALAADTGGAIVGNKIDVHFKTVDECYSWGSKTITITILN